MILEVLKNWPERGFKKLLSLMVSVLEIDLDNNEFMVSRDVSFVEDVFPYEHENIVEKTLPTGGPDDDWIMDEVVEDRGSSTSSLDKSQTPETDANATPGSLSGTESIAEKEDTTADATEVVEAVTAVVAEPEMGRGCREKVPSVKLRDYISYNAQCVEKKSPPHASDRSIL